MKEFIEAIWPVFATVAAFMLLMPPAFFVFSKWATWWLQ